ncbi:MAG: prepilin-type N-terminal cleavage/methylation domain-containing protein [Candidatus Riflebacteria bacterium]|nr:prepilin-type N-terminal cleavage/methylation domain-containing protein [Candidatus Riflebacteria bacterium]
MTRRRGFSLIEVLIACFLLAVVLLSLLWMNRHSHLSSMDAYYEGIAMSVAREPLEIFRGMGYAWLDLYRQGKADLSGSPVLQACPHGSWYNIADAEEGLYPSEACDLKRLITVAPADADGMKGFQITVDVAPAQQTRVDTWLSRDVVTLKSFVSEKK